MSEQTVSERNLGSDKLLDAGRVALGTFFSYTRHFGAQKELFVVFGNFSKRTNNNEKFIIEMYQFRTSKES